MEIQRKSKTSSSSFPTDLTTEILLRLPMKSTVRFRCVSKFWLSVTTDPYFINLLKTRNRRLLICFQEDDELVVSSIPQHTLSLDQNSRNSSYSNYSKPTHSYRMKFPELTHCLPPTASVHGLICFRTYTSVIVWNPSTRQFLTLPKPDKNWRFLTTFLGYDPVEAKHKVIAFNRPSAFTVCRVITLGGSAQEEEWRIVKTNQKHTTFYVYNNSSGQCINGVLYYLASSTDRTYPRVWFIMRFDVRSEKFNVIQLQSDIHVDRLITYEGKLACVHKEESTKMNVITLSILEDEEENKWSSKEFIAPFCHHDQSLQGQFHLVGFTHAGEFIYKPYSRNALLFDPVRNSFRRFGFNGMEDDDEELQYQLHIFPNHIESLLSL